MTSCAAEPARRCGIAARSGSASRDGQADDGGVVVELAAACGKDRRMDLADRVCRARRPRALRGGDHPLDAEPGLALAAADDAIGDEHEPVSRAKADRGLVRARARAATQPVSL